MPEKSAEIHTLAPRLAVLEDKADAAASTDSNAIFKAILFGAQSGGTFTDTPWAESDFSYDLKSPSFVSMHQSLFGSGTSMTALQDGKGLFGWTYRDTENRWNSSASGYTLSTDIFDEESQGYVTSLRSAGKSLCDMIFKDASYIGPSTSDTIIGRIENLQSQLDALADQMQAEVDRLDARIDAL